MSVLYSKACPGSHRSRALALWLPQCRGDLPSNIPHTTPSSRFKNRTVQYSTFIRLYWYTSREFRTRFARLMPCTIPSDSPAINFVSKRPWQTFLQTAISNSISAGCASSALACPSGDFVLRGCGTYGARRIGAAEVADVFPRALGLK